VSCFPLELHWKIYTILDDDKFGNCLSSRLIAEPAFDFQRFQRFGSLNALMLIRPNFFITGKFLND